MTGDAIETEEGTIFFDWLVVDVPYTVPNISGHLIGGYLFACLSVWRWNKIRGTEPKKRRLTTGTPFLLLSLVLFFALPSFFLGLISLIRYVWSVRFEINLFIPLIAALAYTPLLVVLVSSRPWHQKQRSLLLFVIAAVLWSLSVFLFSSGIFVGDRFVLLLLSGISVCLVTWMLVQLHYFASSFYRYERIRIPLAYAFLVATVVLAATGLVPRTIGLRGWSLSVDYGPWMLAVVLLFLCTIGARDVHSLVKRLKVSSDRGARSQIALLLATAFIVTLSILSCFNLRADEYFVPHIGNIITAFVLTYAVLTRRLLDVRTALADPMAWMHRHLNWTLILGYIAALIVAVLPLSILASSDFFYDYDTVHFQVFIHIFFGCLWFALVSMLGVWYLDQKGKSRWHLIWWLLLVTYPAVVIPVLLPFGIPVSWLTGFAIMLSLRKQPPAQSTTAWLSQQGKM